MVRSLEHALLSPQASIRDAMEALNRNRLGMVCIVDSEQRLLGTFTDGDIRRALLRGVGLGTEIAGLMGGSPVTVHVDDSHSDILRTFTTAGVRQLPVISTDRRVEGVYHFEDFIDEPRTPFHAVVMAGGLGTRLGSLTDSTPKPLIEVGGKPILERIVEHLGDSGVQDIFITTRYLAEKIESYFEQGDAWGVSIRYVREEQRLGTAGGLKHLEGTMERPFLVMNGDLLTDFDVRSMFEFHTKHDADMTVAVRHYGFEVPFGVVDVEGVRITALSEKPTFDFFVNAGIYIVDPRLLRYIRPDQVFDITELIEIAIAEGLTVVSFPVLEQWIDVGKPEDLERAQVLVDSGN